MPMLRERSATINENPICPIWLNSTGLSQQTNGGVIRLLIHIEQIYSSLSTIYNTINSLFLTLGDFNINIGKFEPIIVFLKSNENRKITIQSVCRKKQLSVSVSARNCYISLPPSIENGNIILWPPVLTFLKRDFVPGVESSVLTHEVIHMVSCTNWITVNGVLFRKCGVLVECYDPHTNKFSYQNEHMKRINEFLVDYVASIIHKMAFQLAYDRMNLKWFSDAFQKISFLANQLMIPKEDICKQYLLCSLSENFVSNVYQMFTE